MNLEEQILEDAVADILPTKDELTTLANLARRQLDLEEQQGVLNATLNVVNESLRQVREIDIPEIMAEIGVRSIKLTDGSEVTIKEEIYASIRAAMSEKAFHWLNENNLGDVIKREISVKFGRGLSEDADELMEYSREHGLSASDKHSVHAMTLKALVKEQMERGVVFPPEYFSIAPVKKSIIKTK